MASVSVLSAPRPAVVGHFHQAETSDSCRIQPTDELRYTLESYQPSQLQDPPESYSLQPYSGSTQGCSSGYVTGASDQKTPERRFEKRSQYMYIDPVGEGNTHQNAPERQFKKRSQYMYIDPVHKGNTHHGRILPEGDANQITPERRFEKRSQYMYIDPVHEEETQRGRISPERDVHCGPISPDGTHGEMLETNGPALFESREQLESTPSPHWEAREEVSHFQDTQFPQSKTRPLVAVLTQLHDLDPTLRNLLKNADEHLRKGALNDAIQCLEKSLLQSNDYPRLQMVVWMLLGSAHSQLGQYKKASVCHLHYLAFCREMQDFHGMTKAECNLGIAYMKLGLLKLAGRCFLQYLENSRILQDDVGIAAACSNLGMLSKTLGLHGYKSALKEGQSQQASELLGTNLYRAVAYFEQHLDIMEQYGDLEKQARAYGNLGSCYELLKQYTQAIFCQNKRLEIVRMIGDKVSECCSLCNLGNCFRATGKLQEAMEYYHLGYELSQVTNNHQMEMVSLLNLGTTCELRNNLDKAIEWHTLYLSMAVQHNDLRGQARGLSTLAGLFEETGQFKKEHEYYNKLVGIFKRLGDDNAQLSAAHYLQASRQLLKEERKQNKKTLRGTIRKRFQNAFKSHTVSRGRSAHSNQSLFLHDVERSGPTRDKMGTWPRIRAKQSLSETRAPISNSESFSSTLVFENPATTFLEEQYRYQEELASQVAEQAHFSTRASSPDSTLCFPYTYHSREPSEVGHPLYSLVNIPSRSPVSTTSSSDPNHPPPLPPRRYSHTSVRSDADTESSASYQSIPDMIPVRLVNQAPPFRAPADPSIQKSPLSENPRASICSSCSNVSSQVWESQTHLDQLQRVREELTQSERGSEEGVDKEWEQWLSLRDMNSLSRVVSMNRGERRDSIFQLKPTLSAPHMDLHSNHTDSSSVYTESSLPL